MSHEKFQACIETCNECAVVCNHCATACLKEKDVERMRRCIQLDMECAAICRSAAEIMSLGSSYAMKFCQLCAEVCEACGTECATHSQMDHCQVCAETCRRCADECRKMSREGASILN